MEDKVKFHREPLKLNWTLRTDNKTFKELKQEHNEFCNRPEIVKIRNHIENNALAGWDFRCFSYEIDVEKIYEQRFDGEKYLGIFDTKTGCQLSPGYGGDL